MTSCVFPGSFDPVTLGHMDLIRRASKMYDQVTVTVMVNIHKKGTFDPETRVNLLQRACEEIANVHVDRWEGLLADYMKKQGESIVIRGARSAGEFETETVNARINAMLLNDLETVFIPASNGLECVSSTAVREIAAFGGDIKPFVPSIVADDIEKILKEER